MIIVLSIACAIICLVLYNLYFNIKYSEGDRMMMQREIEVKKLNKQINNLASNSYLKDINYNQNFSKSEISKSIKINTFYAFTSTLDKIEHNTKCVFYHHKFEDGTSEIVINISGQTIMKFNLIKEPHELGEKVFFMMSVTEGDIEGINMLMSDNSAHITFPDGNIITFLSKEFIK
ncbi:hypothetical protein CW731_03195 [Polaribacter sp. ALD11]|uniref:hypothetical protein n=1 Tax=Polaribacter sp. ALD11 TaxID=2058137 RepID=UPI000C30851B|nr:hypothetical protein [Polaribacter sp. ALD11]AUC84362.1 hypothetical protein CW731_03195 [Polaribacter sp. ALD11]